MTHANAERQARIRDDIRAERHRQHQKWGDQTHLPDGTDYDIFAGMLEAARISYDDAKDDDYLTFQNILWEEVAEAFTETNPGRLRAELVQVAAVAVQWIEAIDGRADQ